MTIRQPWAFALALLLALGFLGYVAERLIFLQKAARTTGTVVSVEAYNSSCGGGRRRSSYPCTKYRASISFTALDKLTHRFTISAGSARGSNQPKNRARPAADQKVPVVYDPKNPGKAYEDSIWGVWGVPISLLIAHLISLFTSLSEPRRRFK